jgi:hypothetical protein
MLAVRPLMIRFPIAIATFTLLGLLGCGKLSLEPRMVGTFRGHHSEQLIFQSDSRVTYSEVRNGHEVRSWLGFAFPIPDRPGEVRISGPDSTPFLGTEFRFNGDYSRVTVRWNDLRESPQSRASDFER